MRIMKCSFVTWPVEVSKNRHNDFSFSENDFRCHLKKKITAYIRHLSTSRLMIVTDPTRPLDLD